MSAGILRPVILLVNEMREKGGFECELFVSRI
jgi:hypothetical protein